MAAIRIHVESCLLELVYGYLDLHSCLCEQTLTDGHLTVQAPGRVTNDVGALCPQLEKPEQGLDLLQEAITSLGLSPGVDFHLVLNCAAHEALDFVSYATSISDAHEAFLKKT